MDTYGCQQNEADSERLRGYLARMGYAFSDTEEGADLVLVNTCAIREHAEHRVFGNVGALSHTKRRHPEQIICLCGCMARQDHVAQRLKQSFPYVDLVFGPQLLWQFPQLLWEKLESGKRVFATQDVPGAVARGHPRGAAERPEGLGVHHVRVQQLLHLLHRPLRPGAGAQPPAGGHPGRGPGTGRGGGTRTSPSWGRT